MPKRKIPSDHSVKSSYVCLVCGDKARGLNFNVMTCMPCKTFFRKHAFKKSNETCEFQNDCQITKITRGFCSSCRLKKCLLLGMDSELIRSIPQSHKTSKKVQPSKKTEENEIALPVPAPLGLLRNDRSTLTYNEWTLLSNCLHAYDEQKIHQSIQCCLDHLSSLPPKLRLKSVDTYNIVGQFFATVHPLIERSPDLNSLPLEALRALTKHNLNSTGAVNGIFICRELDLYRNPSYWNPCNLQYGSEFMTECTRNSARCDPNSSLIKIILFVLAFSSNCSIVTFNSQEPLTTMMSSIDLIRIQNVYVTMLWKYFVHLYGFKEAVIRYSYMVKNILDIIRMLGLMPKNETHDTMVETIVTETERALVIKG